MNTRHGGAPPAPAAPGDPPAARPRGLLSPGLLPPGEQTRHVLNLDNFHENAPDDVTPPRSPDPHTQNVTGEGTPLSITQPARPHTTHTTPESASPPSALAHAARNDTSSSLSPALAWQREVGGEATKQKAFHREVMQQNDLVAFAFMRSNSPFIHILHSASTFASFAGDVDYKGRDIGFLGDRTPTQNPLPVLLPNDTFKWVSKQASLDALAMEHFYAVPANATKLWQPPAQP